MTKENRNVSASEELSPTATGEQSATASEGLPTPAPEVRSTTFESPELHVVHDGPADAPVLVLIHGFAASARSWDPLVPLLAEGHHVIRIDLLGHGRSPKPAGADLRITSQARRVGAVLDRLGVAPALVVGHSTGGSVVTALAEQRPDLATALVLINSGPGLGAVLPGGSPLLRLLFVPVLGRLLWLFRTDALLRRAAASAVTRDVELPQSLIDDVRGLPHHAFVGASRAADAYLSERPLPERLSGLGRPLLVLFGDQDRRWRSASAEDYRLVPGVRIEMLPGVGHSPPIEEPAGTAGLLREFAAERARGRGAPPAV